VAGHGNGFVDVFNTNGTLAKRFASRGELNSPWGLAPAPAGFGRFSNDVLVGDFGDGRINAYGPDGDFHGQLKNEDHHDLTISGLWGLRFGNGVENSGDAKTLYFTAGLNAEKDGLFGSLTPMVCKHGPAHDDDDDC